MRYLILIITMFCLFSCGEIDKSKIGHLVKEWNNKEIVYPNKMQFTILGVDTSFLSQSECNFYIEKYGK